jgi:hypothetical protein
LAADAAPVLVAVVFFAVALAGEGAAAGIFGDAVIGLVDIMNSSGSTRNGFRPARYRQPTPILKSACS